MGLLDRSKIDIQLILHALNAEYTPGDTFSGVIEIVVKKEVSWRGIRLRIKGEEYANSGGGKSYDTNTRIHYDKIYTFAGESSTKRRMKDSALLLVDIDDEDEEELMMTNSSNKLQPGSYKYPFEVILPEFLPPSFDVRCMFNFVEAHITYTAKAYVDIPNGFDAECVKKFYVLSAIPREYLNNKKITECENEALISHARLHKFSCLGCFCCAKEGEVIITEATINPKVIVVDELNHLGRTNNYTNNDYHEKGTIRLNVKVLNDTRKTLCMTRVQIINIVDVNPHDLPTIRRVNVGEPLIFRDAIPPGESKSFAAFFSPGPIFPFSVLENNEEEENNEIEANRFAAHPLIPKNKQKKYILNEQPLLTFTSAFVNSRCVLYVDFPGIDAKGTIEAENAFLLASTVDEKNLSSNFPRVYDSKCKERREMPNNAYSSHPYLHNYDSKPEEARCESLK